MAEYTFETKLKEHTITIDGNPYTLREMNGIQRDKYLNKMAAKVEMGPGGQIQSVKDFSGTEVVLLEECLFDVENKPVPAKVMQEWPSTILGRLFDLAQELSGMTEEARENLEAEAKNS